MNLEKQVLEFLNCSLNWYLSTTPCLFLEKTNKINENEIVIFEIENMTEFTEEKRLRAIENVLNALPINDTNFFYLIHGLNSEIRYFYGVVPTIDCHCCDDLRNIELSAEVLQTSLEGNFPDSIITPINQEGIENLLDEINELECNVMVEGTPGVLNTTNLILGIDNIPTVMMEDNFVYLVIGKRFTLDEIICSIAQIEDIDNLLSIITEEIITKQCTDSNSNSCANSLTNFAAYSDSFSRNRQIQKGIPLLDKNKVAPELIEENGDILEETSSNLIKLDGTAKTNVKQSAINNARTNTNTSTRSEAILIRDIFGNMSAREWRTYIQTILYPRLNYALGNSLYLYTTILKTNQRAILNKLESITKSIYSGSSGNNIPIKFTCINQNKHALKAFQEFQLLKYFKQEDCTCKNFSCEEINARSVFSQVITCDLAFGGNLVSSRELGIMVSLPNTTSTQNFSSEYRITDSNVESIDVETHSILLGNYVRNGKILISQKVILRKNIVTKNIIFTGSYKKIMEPMLSLILEQSEYPYCIVNTKMDNQRVRELKNITVYYGYETDTGIFPINMFQFTEGDQIQSQVDFLKLCFQTINPLSDMLLSIVERGCYECYIDYGWDIETSQNSWFGDESFSNNKNTFPILSDLIEKVKSLLDTEITDDNMREKVRLELRTKVEVLMIGKKAVIYNTHHSVDFQTILEQKSILNLTSIYSLYEREFYIALLVHNLYHASKSKKMLQEDYHFLTAWYGIPELLRKQSKNQDKRRDFYEQYIEYASFVGLSYYLFDSTPGRIDNELMQQIPTVITGQLSSLEDVNSIDNRIRLTKDQRKRLFELEQTRVFFSLDNDSTVHECECCLDYD